MLVPRSTTRRRRAPTSVRTREIGMPPPSAPAEVDPARLRWSSRIAATSAPGGTARCLMNWSETAAARRLTTASAGAGCACCPCCNAHLASEMGDPRVISTRPCERASFCGAAAIKAPNDSLVLGVPDVGCERCVSLHVRPSHPTPSTLPSSHPPGDQSTLPTSQLLSPSFPPSFPPARPSPYLPPINPSSLPASHLT